MCEKEDVDIVLLRDCISRNDDDDDDVEVNGTALTSGVPSIGISTDDKQVVVSSSFAVDFDDARGKDVLLLEGLAPVGISKLERFDAVDIKLFLRFMCL